MREPAYKSWARARELKPRCRLCGIVLVRGRPPTPCYRRECRFSGGDPEPEPSSPIPSSLGGGDYSEIR